MLRSNGCLHCYQDRLAWPEQGRVNLMKGCRVGEWKDVAGSLAKKSWFRVSDAFGIVLEDETIVCLCETEEESQ